MEKKNHVLQNNLHGPLKFENKNVRKKMMTIYQFRKTNCNFLMSNLALKIGVFISQRLLQFGIHNVKLFTIFF